LAFTLTATYSAPGCSAHGKWADELVWIEESN
jgi:hypothetical protein